MFDAIAIRRTAPFGAPGGPIDLGRLAEAMLFYRKVRLAVTRHSLKQLIVLLGPDVALKLARNPNVELIYLDRDLALRSEDSGTRRARHRPATVTLVDKVQRGDELVVVPESLESVVTGMFREATGRSGAGGRMAKRFLNQTQAYEFSPDLLGLAKEDWEDDAFVRQLVVDVVAEFAPTYSIPSDLRVSLVPTADDHYQFETNLDWAAVSKAGSTVAGDMRLDPVTLLLGMVEMRQDLVLGASFGASLAQDRLGERIMRTKCKELVAQLEGQQGKVAQFQEVVVNGVGDLRGAINSGHRSFGEFLDLLEKAEHFRTWLDDQVPTTDLVDEYYANVFKKSPLEKHPLKELRWSLPTAAEIGIINVAHPKELLPPLAALGMVAVDQLIVERFKKGWRPGTFVNDELVPFVNG